MSEIVDPPGNLPPAPPDGYSKHLTTFYPSPLQCFLNPEDITVKKLFASIYELHDHVQNLGQRTFMLEGAVAQMRGEIEELRGLVIKVQPDKLAAVAEQLKNSPRERIKRAIQNWIRD